MAATDAITARLVVLVDRGRGLAQSGDEHDQLTNERTINECAGWLAAAQNIVHLIAPSQNAPYRQRIEDVVTRSHGFGVHNAVGQVTAILIELRADAANGLLASVADRTSGEVFDDFLDHAEHYVREKRKNEAGAIAGVVFEDTTRRICKKYGITEAGAKLDTLISQLAAGDILTGVQAKRARAVADVRTKATHAQWDEFQLEDVQAAITFTREIIDAKLSS